MKKIFFFLLCIIALQTHAQTQVAYDSTYKTFHDSSYNATISKTQQTTHDSIVSVKSNATISVSHDTIYLVHGWRKSRLKTVTTTHDSVIEKISAGAISTTHDTTIISAVVLTTAAMHDTTSTFFKTVQPPIQFGAKLQGKVDSQLIGHSALFTKWNRTGVILPFMDGKKDNSIMQFLQGGYNVFINISCNDPRNNPQPWYRDTVQYEKWLRTFFDLYKADFAAYKAKGQRIVFGQDNEPLNQNYHGTDSLENYFTLARTFNKVCHEYGMQTADGASFVESIYALLTGYNKKDLSLAFKIYRQGKYIDLMKSAGFDYSNSHWGINDDSVTDNEAKIATDYLVDQLGIPTVSNEFHYYMATAKSGTIGKGVNEWRKTKCQFVIVWSGNHLEGTIINKTDNSFNGSPADMLVTEDGKLTPLGVQFRDAIKQ